MYLHFELQMFR